MNARRQQMRVRPLVTMERVRMMAVRLSLAGKSRQEVCKRFRIHDRTLRRWLETHRQYGFGGLKSKPHQGSAPKLSDQQRAQVVRWLFQPPRKFGVVADRWTGANLAPVIKLRFGIDINPRHVLALFREDFAKMRAWRRARRNHRS